MNYMIFSNFRAKHMTENRVVADVDVTTVERGFWWFQKTETTCTREVARDKDWWYFTDTGHYCPGDLVDRLERAWNPDTPT